MKAAFPAAFRRLCVETLLMSVILILFVSQPPSGGCVLKLNEHAYSPRVTRPAAFRRLCVETGNSEHISYLCPPAAFRRLCVETIFGLRPAKATNQPPSGGCVLKHDKTCSHPCHHDPAAFRRLCVETFKTYLKSLKWSSSRLQAAVC